jgi:phenylpyruvate tautomerase PptA (4-oxalocrotonate tautomerase family)
MPLDYMDNDRYLLISNNPHEGEHAMPLTLTISEGVIPQEKKQALFKGLCDAMLKWHGLTGNKVMTPNVVGTLNELPQSNTFAGGENNRVAFIEWKVPGFAFANREIQEGYVAEVTELLHDISNGSLPKENIWVNVIHAVDGAWGISGQALTNDQLKEAISQG